MIYLIVLNIIDTNTSIDFSNYIIYILFIIIVIYDIINNLSFKLGMNKFLDLIFKSNL